MINNKVFVVTYQHYIYPDGGDVEFKDLMTNPVDVKGVFSTKKKAEDFIKRDLKNEAIVLCGNDRKEVKEYIEKYEYHYSIDDIELDKQVFH